jgi:fumarate hydratase class II
MIMVCIQVIADDNAVAFAGSQGNFELNTMRPLIINNVLHAARILSDCCSRFNDYCITGIELNRKRIDGYVQNSLMLVTALSPLIGYDKAAIIAQKALAEDLSLKEAALATGFIDEVSFDLVVDPLKMTGR